MKINRVWCMPSKWTFTLKPVAHLLNRYKVGEGWVDPFAGENSMAEATNDIEGRGASSKMDGLAFLRGLPDSSYGGALFDPPYSVDQCLREYTPRHNGTAGRTEYHWKCKRQIARIIKKGGISISFGWNSAGIGKTSGFKIVEILLLCHGAGHQDTIVTVERKHQDIQSPYFLAASDRNGTASM